MNRYEYMSHTLQGEHKCHALISEIVETVYFIWIWELECFGNVDLISD